MSEAELAKQRQRVKVYSYSESGSWDDMGTGHVTIDFMERNNATTIIVRSEEDGLSLISIQHSLYQSILYSDLTVLISLRLLILY